MGCGGHDTGNALLRDGAQVGHGETVSGEVFMESGEGHAALYDDILLLDVDLGEREIT